AGGVEVDVPDAQQAVEHALVVVHVLHALEAGLLHLSPHDPTADPQPAVRDQVLREEAAQVSEDHGHDSDRDERDDADGSARRPWPGHFFIATDLVGTPGFLDWDGIRALVAMGHVVGSHSCSHPDRMADLSWDQLLDEWSRSAAALSSELGQEVSTASVPGGL